jgi:hypothetical protein
VEAPDVEAVAHRLLRDVAETEQLTLPRLVGEGLARVPDLSVRLVDDVVVRLR